ncbi:MAG: hypothetical protein ACLSHC_07465 [Bilophila wadsworthia]
MSGLLTMALALGTLLFGTVGAGWLIGKVGVSSTFMALAVLFLGIIVLGSLFLRMPEAAPGKEEGDGVGLRDMLHTPSIDDLGMDADDPDRRADDHRAHRSYALECG